MTQKDKELRLKDLCTRLPYEVKAQVYNHWRDEVQDETITIENLHQLIKTFSIEDIKPYLFPLSSMTEEQEKELSKLGISYGEYALHDDIRGLGIMVDEAYIFFEFCYKHHIDFLGLIEKGLAKDATGKGIY